MTCAEAVAVLAAAPKRTMLERVVAAFRLPPLSPAQEQMVAAVSLRKLMEDGRAAEVLPQADPTPTSTLARTIEPSHASFQPCTNQEMLTLTLTQNPSPNPHRHPLAILHAASQPHK